MGKRPCLRPLFRRSSPHFVLQERFQIRLADPPLSPDLQRRDELLVNHFPHLLLCGFQQRGGLSYGEKFGHAHGSSPFRPPTSFLSS